MDRKFIVDFMLGRLCRWLRLIGEDAEYFRGNDKGGIIYRALKERRIILTRDRNLSRKKALQIYPIENENFKIQLEEVIKEFDIKIVNNKIFTRCLECNRELEAITKNKIKNKVPEYVYETHEEFSVCVNCMKIYWSGTHAGLIRKVLDKISDKE